MKLVYFEDPHGNFGDDLNPWLWDKLLPGVIDGDATDGLLIGMGTVLEPWFVANLPTDAPKHVLGSGIRLPISISSSQRRCMAQLLLTRCEFADRCPQTCAWLRYELRQKSSRREVAKAVQLLKSYADNYEPYLSTDGNLDRAISDFEQKLHGFRKKNDL